MAWIEAYKWWSSGYQHKCLLFRYVGIFTKFTIICIFSYARLFPAVMYASSTKCTSNDISNKESILTSNHFKIRLLDYLNTKFSRFPFNRKWLSCPYNGKWIKQWKSVNINYSFSAKTLRIYRILIRIFKRSHSHSNCNFWILFEDSQELKGLKVSLLREYSESRSLIPECSHLIVTSGGNNSWLLIW